MLDIHYRNESHGQQNEQCKYSEKDTKTAYNKHNSSVGGRQHFDGHIVDREQVGHSASTGKTRGKRHG